MSEEINPSLINNALDIKKKDKKVEEGVKKARGRGRPKGAPNKIKPVTGVANKELERTGNFLIYTLMKRGVCKHGSHEPEGHFTRKDVEDINLTKGIIDLLAFYGIQVSHPIVSVVIKAVNLVVLVYTKCINLQEKVLRH